MAKSLCIKVLLHQKCDSGGDQFLNLNCCSFSFSKKLANNLLFLYKPKLTCVLRKLR